MSDSNIVNAGRGVFAKLNIKKGKLIESCPLIIITPEECDLINQTSLVHYIYYLGDDKNHLVIPLGMGAIYNHSYSPNAKYRAKLKSNLIDFIAIVDIKKDEEILINYNQGSKSKDPLWFEV